MPWVAIDIHIASDPAVHRIAAALRIRVPEVVGLLSLTFAGMVQHAPNGELAGVPDTLLEEWARWHGKRGAFAVQFRAELTDETGLVRSWEKYNGANLRRLEGARERSRLYRENQERERNERAAERTQSANGTHSRTHTETHTELSTVRIPYASTGQDRTEPTHLTATAGGADAPRRAPKSVPSWASSIADRWISRIGHTTPARVQRALGGSVAVHGEKTILAALDLYATARLSAGKDRKLDWFAEDVAAWVLRVAEANEPLVDASGTLTARGERLTRPGV